MPVVKFTTEQVGGFKSILDLGWSLRHVQRYFKERNVDVSLGYLSVLRSGKDYHLKSSNSKPRGRKPKLSPNQIRAILKRVDNVDPPTQASLAAQYNVSPSTICRLIKKSNRRKVKKPRVHAMSPDTMEKRYRRSWQLYRLLRKNRWRRVITCDEAWFYLRTSQGKRGIQYLKLSQKRSEAEVQPHQQHPKGVMVWIAFSADGFFKPIFIEEGAKINSLYYCKKVIEPFHKEYKQKYPENQMLLHQDSAPSHVSKFTVPFLKKKQIKFITKDQWMPSSPDCAPCDYWLFGYLKNRVQKRKVKTIAGLKKAIRQEVKNIPIWMVERALRSWPRRCRLVYYNKGGYIENFM